MTVAVMASLMRIGSQKRRSRVRSRLLAVGLSLSLVLALIPWCGSYVEVFASTATAVNLRGVSAVATTASHQRKKDHCVLSCATLAVQRNFVVGSPRPALAQAAVFSHTVPAASLLTMMPGAEAATTAQHFFDPQPHPLRPLYTLLSHLRF